MKSLAYEIDTSGFDSDKSIISLDLIGSDFNGKVIKNFPNLKTFRCSFDYKITEIEFINCPSLESVDLSNNPYLTSVKFSKCSSIKVIDLSCSKSCSVLKGNFDSLQVLLIMSTKLRELPKIPKIKHADLRCFDGVKEFNIAKHRDLESLAIHTPKEILFSDVANHPSLIYAQLYRVAVKFDKITKPRPKPLFIQTVGFKVSADYLKDSNICLFGSNCFITPFEHMFTESTYRRSMKLLWGPYAIPPVDLLPVQKPPAVLKAPINDSTKSATVDGLLGAIFGSAVMDMIGVGVEFLGGAESKVLLREPYDIDWQHPAINPHNVRFTRGNATDDTSQAVLIMRSLIKASMNEQFKADGVSKFDVGGLHVDLGQFGSSLLDWATNGHEEHRQHGGLGLGRTVMTVITSPRYKSDPLKVAEEVWEAGNRSLAANGSVMRTSPCCLPFWDSALVEQLASLFGRATHADRRCVFCTVLISRLAAAEISKRAGLIDAVDIDSIIDDVIARYPGEDEAQTKTMLEHVRAESIEDLCLAEEEKIGYCLKATGAAVWCLRKSPSFVAGMEAVLREGGDADTNGAVVGAVLGAKFGFSEIPRETLQRMHCGQWLFREAAGLLSLIGINPPPSPWIH